MKRKLAFLSFAACILLAALVGCQAAATNDNPVQQSAYKKIQKALVNLDTYQSNATVEYISNKGSNTYGTLQQCKSSGEYRIEVTAPTNVAGNVTLFDGKMIYQYNPKIAGKLSMATKETPERSEIFLNSFVKNYLNSQNVSVSVANMEEGQCTVLEANIPGAHPYMRTEKLWVDNDTQLPVKLVIYDPDGTERIIVTYQDFEYNIPLEDSLFQLQ